MNRMSPNGTIVQSGFIWPVHLLQEISTVYNKCLSESTLPEKSFDTEQFVDSLLKLLFIRSTKADKENFKAFLMKVLTKKMNLGDCLSHLEDYAKSCIDFGPFNVKTDSKIGLKSIISQLENEVISRGIDLNILIAGKSGLGKSTLIDTIFRSSLNRRHQDSTLSDIHEIPPTCTVKSIHHILEEDGYRIKLCITDTPGFGDLLVNDKCWECIRSFIEKKFETHLSNERNPFRNPLSVDNRVHCCIYVIPPNGHKLSSLDLEFLKKINGLVNIIPVIGRSDSLTKEEIIAFKQRIMNDLIANKIDIFPKLLFSLDDEVTKEAKYKEIFNAMPLGVVGANLNTGESDGHSLLRTTPFGNIQIENPEHCDFSILMDVLIRKHTLTLIQTTDKIFYENFIHSRYTNETLKAKTKI